MIRSNKAMQLLIRVARTIWAWERGEQSDVQAMQQLLYLFNQYQTTKRRKPNAKSEATAESTEGDTAEGNKGE
jgi:hypothetical protein